MSSLPQRDARYRNTERRVAALKLFTRCFGDKVAAADKCLRETVTRGNSHRLPSVLNPPVWRNKVYVSGGYLTPVITERPTLHRNTHRLTRGHTHSCSSSLLFPVVVAKCDGWADRQLLLNATSWNVLCLHLATRSTDHPVLKCAPEGKDQTLRQALLLSHSIWLSSTFKVAQGSSNTAY